MVNIVLRGYQSLQAAFDIQMQGNIIMLVTNLFLIGPATGPRFAVLARGQRLRPIQQIEDLQLGQYEITWLMIILLINFNNINNKKT